MIAADKLGIEVPDDLLQKAQCAIYLHHSTPTPVMKGWQFKQLIQLMANGGGQGKGGGKGGKGNGNWGDTGGGGGQSRGGQGGAWAQGGQHGGGKPSCNRCGLVGHQGYLCESRTNGIPCEKCGNTGHTAAKCHTKDKAERNALGTVACTGCGEFDHSRPHCPWKGHQCTTCKKTGHAEAVCWETTKKQPSKDQSKTASPAAPTPAKHQPQALLNGEMWFQYICQQCDVPIRDPDLIAVVCPNPRCRKPIKDSKCGTEETGPKKTILSTFTKESILFGKRLDGAVKGGELPLPKETQEAVEKEMKLKKDLSHTAIADHMS